MQQAESIEQKVIELLDKVEAGAIDAAPEAAEITLRAVYWDGLTTLLTGAALLIVAIVFYWVAVRPAINLCRREIDKYGETDMGAPVVMMSGFACLIILVAAATNLFTRSAWVAIFDPEAAFALKIIGGW